MAKTKRLSDSAKRRILERQWQRTKGELAKIEAKLESCYTCNADKLEKELRRRNDEYEKDLKALEAKFGITLKAPAVVKAAKVATKVAKPRKRPAPPATVIELEVAAPVARAKKTAKKKAAKKSPKKASKKASKRPSKAIAPSPSEVLALQLPPVKRGRGRPKKVVVSSEFRS